MKRSKRSISSAEYLRGEISTATDDRISRIISAEWSRGSSDTRNWDLELYTEAGKKMLQHGSVFLAHDILSEGCDHYPNDTSLMQQEALALARLGDTKKAQSILLDLYRLGDLHPETLGILGRTYKDQWLKTRDPRLLAKASDIYREGFEANHDEYNGINAATSSLLMDEYDEAKNIAGQVIKICQKRLVEETPTPGNYWIWASLGEAYLILGDEQNATDCYQQAFHSGKQKYGNRATTIRQARIILDHLQSRGVMTGTPGSALMDVLNLGSVVVFIGHMLDRPERQVPRFPPSAEREVRLQIDKKLDAMNATIGYCSAACGADILFVEAMLSRGAAVHIHLPFRKEDFLDTSVRFAGGDWVERFNIVLDTATSVIEPVEEAYLGDNCLFEYGNEVMIGKALLAGDMLETSPILLTVWDGRPGDGLAGTHDAVDTWRRRFNYDIETIDISSIVSHQDIVENQADNGYVPYSPKNPKYLQRDIRAMLFADVTGFSRLYETQVPYFIYDFFGAIKKLLERQEVAPIYRNTWGDGLFCVFEGVMEAAQFALELRDLVIHTDWEQYGLPKETNIRIALHSGPVYSGIDPVSGRLNYYGSHVSYSARLEPITNPGSVYTTEPFAALLRAQGSSELLCEYVGKHELAKGYGRYPVYLLRHRDEMG